MTEQELIEALADKEHASWAAWMAYLLGNLKRNDDGSLTIPSSYVEAFQRQINTPYAEMTEAEKQLDRDEVEHILPIIREYAQQGWPVFEGWGKPRPCVDPFAEGE